MGEMSVSELYLIGNYDSIKKNHRITTNSLPKCQQALMSFKFCSFFLFVCCVFIVNIPVKCKINIHKLISAKKCSINHIEVNGNFLFSAYKD